MVMMLVAVIIVTKGRKFAVKLYRLYGICADFRDTGSANNDNR